MARLFGRDDEARIVGWRGVIADVTEQVAAQERLHHLAHTDSLTGLANRFTLHGALRAAIAQQRLVALLALDLDHFKLVNDTLGHAAGDELLQNVAARLLACRRPADLVARLGGDEFAVLVLDDGEPGLDVDALCQRLIEALEEPVDIGGRAPASASRARRARARPSSARTTCWCMPTSRCTPPRRPAAAATRRIRPTSATAIAAA